VLLSHSSGIAVKSFVEDLVLATSCAQLIYSQERAPVGSNLDNGASGNLCKSFVWWITCEVNRGVYNSVPYDGGVSTTVVVPS
jgi:hypothetical protein